jgi:hypothetical protein
MIHNAKLITLNQDSLADVLKPIPKTFNQAHSLIQFLNDNPQAKTLEVKRACNIRNIADVARKTNSFLWDSKLQIGCQKPSYDLFNKLSEKSNSYAWGIYKPTDEDELFNSVDLGIERKENSCEPSS